MNISSLDIFCHVVDNFGDAGVAYRFAREFKLARPNCRVRFFISDIAPLSAIAQELDFGDNLTTCEHGGITYINLSAQDSASLAALGVADVMVEMFACHIPQPLMELAYDKSKLIVNIEYLTAENYAEDYHLKESLLGRGSARKFYFMPGFTQKTGGLIINSQLEKERARGFDIRNFIDNCDIADDTLVGTVFTYTRGFDNLLRDLASVGRDTLLLVFGEKSQRGMAATLERQCGIPHSAFSNVRVRFMDFLNQHDYDALLCAADFNIVRGEDSLARAVLSGKPFIWNAYIQDENYQLVKVEALLDTLRQYYQDSELFSAYADLLREFNSMSSESPKQVTAEQYGNFLKNLKKHTHAARELYYFMIQNCNLVKNFCDFLDGYQ